MAKHGLEVGKVVDGAVALVLAFETVFQNFGDSKFVEI
jgi:hypothetical protein